VAGFLLAPLRGLWRFSFVVGGVLLVAPSLGSDIAALVVMAPAIAMQVIASRAATAPALNG
jgi:UPF0716 family protein affecting phage T7 exclusion